MEQLREHEIPKIPTVGRIVHYFSGLNAQPQAAIVTEGGDLAPCLTVFGKHNMDNRLSVQHKVYAINSIPVGEYWDYPEIK